MRLFRICIVVLLVVSLGLMWCAPACADPVVAPAVVALVLSYLASVGISLSLPTDTTSGTVSSTVMDLVDRYLVTAGMTVAEAFAPGAYWLTSNGIRVLPSVAGTLKDFASWLQGSDVGLESNSTVTLVQGSLDLYGLPAFPITLGQTYTFPGGGSVTFSSNNSGPFYCVPAVLDGTYSFIVVKYFSVSGSVSSSCVYNGTTTNSSIFISSRFYVRGNAVLTDLKCSYLDVFNNLDPGSTAFYHPDAVQLKSVSSGSVKLPDDFVPTGEVVSTGGRNKIIR